LLFALFQYDEFTSEDVAMTARSLVAYAAGLVGFVAARLLLAGFAARHDYATPFRLALYAIALNLLLSVLLSSSLVPSGWRHAGIALATGIAGLIHAGWLGVFLRKAGAYRPLPGWGPHVLRVVGGCVAMGALLAYGVGDDAVWGERSALERIGRLGILIASAIAGTPCRALRELVHRRRCPRGASRPLGTLMAFILDIGGSSTAWRKKEGASDCPRLCCCSNRSRGSSSTPILPRRV
jgi:peptidoglycan biosynthesis protein MviN/MurJ (putative lipid II flippase)